MKFVHQMSVCAKMTIIGVSKENRLIISLKSKYTFKSILEKNQVLLVDLYFTLRVILKPRDD